jgi:uncharacterized membrane protein
MSNYPVVYTQDPPEERNRATVFFRVLMVIPLAIWACIWGFAACIAVFIAWFAIVFTGRWPAALYDFVASFTRYSGRVLAYCYLIVDRYPPFDGGEHPEYPVQIVVAPAKDEYSRMKTFFRLLLAIPVYIIQYLFSIWLFVVAIAIWFCGVFAGRTSAGLMEAMRMPMAYYIRANTYFYLLTEDWPPFDPGTGEATAAPLPPQPMAAA